MSIYKNGKLIAGGRQCTPLLSFMWADHRLDEASWLRADTFSWQSGRVYNAVFNHLNNEYVQGALYAWGAPGSYVYTKSNEPSVGDWIYDVNGNRNATYPTVTSVASGYGSISYSTDSGGGHYDYTFGRDSAGDTTLPLESETIEGITVQFCLAADGHKICPASEESNVSAIYNATGVAWYYIIDTTNQRFKLPRINPDLEELAYQISAFGDGDYLRFMSSSDSNKGSYIKSSSESLGSGTGWLRTYNSGDSLVNLGNMKLSNVKGQSGIKVEKDTIFSGKKHLYFYVGNFTQTALENTAGVTTEMLNTKVTVGHEVVEFQAPTSENNYTWYRKYADGWVEQGGKASTPNGGSATVNLPVTMSDANYTINATGTNTLGGGDYQKVGWYTQTSTSFKLYSAGGNGSYYVNTVYWQVSGMAA